MPPRDELTSTVAGLLNVDPAWSTTRTSTVTGLYTRMTVANVCPPLSWTRAGEAGDTSSGRTW